MPRVSPRRRKLGRPRRDIDAVQAAGHAPRTPIARAGELSRTSLALLPSRAASWSRFRTALAPGTTRDGDEAKRFAARVLCASLDEG